ncbi:MAG: type VI secretion system baseplate subunit TssE [Planctomycetaceae bacterium]
MPDEDVYSVQVSLLDRLIDDEPEESIDLPWDEVRKLRIIKEGIKRDLQDLLNTKFRCVAYPPDMETLDDSLLNYGLPDFTSAGLNLAFNSDTLLVAVQRAIRVFEPRLTDVKVEMTEEKFHVDRTFRFRIDAVLLIEHQRHALHFHSAIESNTGQFNVGDGAE